MASKKLIPSGKCPICLGTGKIVDQSALGARIRGARKKARVMLKDIAEEIGITASYLSDLERGKRHWTIQLRDLAEQAIKKYSTA